MPENNHVIPVRVGRCDQFGLGVCVDLSAPHCHKALFKAANGEQHLILGDGDQVVQVRCVGEDIRPGPMVVEIVAPRFPDVESGQRDLRQLADLYRNRRSAGRQDGWTVEATRHRDALIALDRHLAGQSYREIASALYGEKAVSTEWSDPGRVMKNRVVRNVKRGLRMMEGDYIKLLH